MGNTVRRQPINFNIPKSPDYKHLNITDFKGLNISDNPFVVKTNTASDLLNVYVDESNTLTTRPRLERKYSINNITGFVKLLHTYPLSTSKVFHVQTTSGYKLYVLKDNIQHEVIGSIEITNYDYCVFEKNDIYYVVGDGKYLCFDNNYILKNVAGDSQTYIPTTTIRTIGSDAFEDYEKPNILSTKYRTSYFWDLSSDWSEIYNNNGVLIDNGYIKKYQSDDVYRVFSGYSSKSFVTTDSSLLCDQGFSNGYRTAQINDGRIEVGDSFSLARRAVAISSSGKIFVTPTATGNGFTVLDKRTTPETEIAVTLTQGNFIIDIEQNQSKKAYVSENGDYILFILAETFSTSNYNWKLVRYVKKPDNTYQETVVHTNSDHFLDSYNTSLYYKPDNDVSVCSNFGNRWFLYTTSVFGETPVSAFKANDALTSVSGGYENTDFTPDMKKMFIISDNYIQSGNITSDVSVKTQRCYVADGISLVRNFSKDNTRMFFTSDNSVFVYDIENNNYYKLYDLSNISDDAYFEFNVVTPLAVSNDGKLVYIQQYKCDGSLRVPTNPTVQFFANTAEQSTEPLLLVEYDKTPTTQYSDKIDVNISYPQILTNRTIDLSGYDKIYHLTFTEYDTNGLNTNSTDITRLIQEGGFFEIIGVCSFTYDLNTKILTMTPASTMLNVRMDIDIIYSDEINNDKTFDFDSMIRFQNNFWFYGNKNLLTWTLNNNPTYIPETNFTELGDDVDVVKDMILLSFDAAMAFKKDRVYLITPTTLNEKPTYIFTEAKTEIGVIAKNSTIITPLNEIPLYINSTGFYGIQQLKNVQSTDRMSVLYSEKINKKLLAETNLENIKSTKYLYWSVFCIPGTITKIYINDDRIKEWFYWEIPFNITNSWCENDKIYVSDEDGNVFSFEKTDIINQYNPDVTEYYDEGKKLITWYWKSQILPLGTINYSKKLIDTTFIVADTEQADEYALNYKFKAYRKLVSESQVSTIGNRLNYVQSTTKRTLIPRFNFLQIEISNISGGLTDTDISDAFNHNKLRLIGLGLKYTLLEGLI